MLNILNVGDQIAFPPLLDIDLVFLLPNQALNVASSCARKNDRVCSFRVLAPGTESDMAVHVVFGLE